MLETIRQFAAERLADSGNGEAVRRRHAERMFEVARSTHLDDEGDVPTDLGLALAERDDFRAALDWALEHDAELGLKIAVALQNLWNAAGPQEGLRRLTQLLERAGPSSPAVRAAALRVQGGTADMSGEDELAERLWEESVELYRAVGDDRGIAAVEHMLAVSAWRQGDWERMRRLTESSLERARGRFAFVEITGY